jgi:hypothetical protein
MRALARRHKSSFISASKVAFNRLQLEAAPGGTVSRLTGTLLIAALFVVPIAVGKTQMVGAQTQISGTWRGSSECAVKDSPCRDETNVYRFSEVAAQPGWFSGTGSKVVNGKEISMGTLNWQYDVKSHILESRNPNGVFRFVVGDSKMEGTLVLPDATVYRRIHLTKVK